MQRTFARYVPAKATPIDDTTLFLSHGSRNLIDHWMFVLPCSKQPTPKYASQYRQAAGAVAKGIAPNQHATAMFFPHFVGDACLREPHRPPIFLTSRTPIPRYVCVGPDRSAGLDNTGSPGDLRSPGLFNCLNCGTPLSRLSRSFA